MLRWAWYIWASMTQNIQTSYRSNAKSLHYGDRRHYAPLSSRRRHVCWCCGTFLTSHSAASCIHFQMSHCETSLVGWSQLPPHSIICHHRLQKVRDWAGSLGLHSPCPCVTLTLWAFAFKGWWKVLKMHITVFVCVLNIFWISCLVQPTVGNLKVFSLLYESSKKAANLTFEKLKLVNVWNLWFMKQFIHYQLLWINIHIFIVAALIILHY